MIKKFEELNFEKIKSNEEMDKFLKDNLGIGLFECANALSQDLLVKAKEIAQDMPNLVPYNDYERLLEDKGSITQFLLQEAFKEENWLIQFIEVKDQLLELVFFNKAVDEGDLLKGFVFVGLTGKIKHSFVQVNS